MSNAVFTGDSDSAASCNIAIIGAGLAGLSCARKLSIGCPSDDLKMHVYEATDRVGGRVRSDVVDGFTLDHGFQVLLTAYPACRDLLDYEALRLRAFEPGALIRKDGRFRRLGDPWRRPLQAVSTALSPVGTLADKLRIAKHSADGCVVQKPCTAHRLNRLMRHFHAFLRSVEHTG
ncbi:MAG: FAD-dependent oxidoreductase, partial [Planctomycetota bacterium]